MNNMDFLKDWALCLIAAAAAGTLVTVIVPRGSMDKTVRAVVGIFVVAVICSPLSDLNLTDEPIDVFAEYDGNDINGHYTGDMKERIINIFRETVETQVKETASELGAEVLSVNADISVDDEYCINIHKIDVYINRSQSADMAILSEKIGEKLGVTADVIAQ